MNNLLQHNSEIKASAEFRAREMSLYPSPLERKMIDFLHRHNVHFETQKIFYIYASDGWIIRYYIADFFIPEKNLIIEVDGRFHEKQKQHDKDRTKTIMENYPGVEVLRYKWDDFSSTSAMGGLLCRLRQGF